jgi:hypothetical protein
MGFTEQQLQGGGLVTAVIKLEEKAQTQWFKVGEFYRTVYANRAEMVIDSPMFVFFIQEGFSVANRNLIHNEELRKAMPKSLPTEKRELRNKQLLLHRRVDYYLNRLLSATYPSEEDIIANAMKG